MRRLLPTLRAATAACLLLAGTASFAADTADPADPQEPLAALQAAFAQSVTPGERADFYRELLATIWQRVQRSYAREVDLAAFAAVAAGVIEPVPPGTGEPAEVFRKSVNAALRTLDPYSRYLDPRTTSQERGESSGSFGGVGLEVETSGGAVRVVASIPGGPAARAGLQAGDLIVRVDDQPLLGVPLSEAISRMRGQPGTAVSVTIRRTGVEQEFTLSLTRDSIRRQALAWSLEGEVLVLRLATFSAPVTVALERAIAEATAAHAPRGVVLDLRGNGGGLLREAVTVADAFLTRGSIVSLRGRTPSSQRSWHSDDRELLSGLPMVVLVDGRSASASELVAAALQENGRAVVMGQRSFGKGTVQSTYFLGELKGALKLTTSTYHGPSGRSVQRVGVPLDVELVPPQGTESVRRPTPVEAQAEAEVQPLPPPQARVEQARCGTGKPADPVLACAVAYLAAGSIDAFASASADPQP